MGLAGEMAHLQRRAAPGPPRPAVGRRASRCDGEQGLGMGDATTAVAELADLDAVEPALAGLRRRVARRHRRGAVERALGRGAVDDLAALRQLERELERQGYLVRAPTAGSSSPRRRSAGSARPRCAGCSRSSRPPAAASTTCRRRAAGELTGARREWRFGDEQPLDVVRTVRNAVLRGRPPVAARAAPRGAHRRRGLRGRRDRAAHRRRRRAAGRPVLLDGAARHLGRGQVDGDGAALAGDHAVPAGRHPDHRVQRLRAGAAARDARRAVDGHACRAPTCSTG